MEEESTKSCESRRNQNNRKQDQEDNDVMVIRFFGERQERRKQIGDPVWHGFPISIRGIPTENQKLDIFKYKQRERNLIWQFIVLHHGIEQVEENIFRKISYWNDLTRNILLNASKTLSRVFSLPLLSKRLSGTVGAILLNCKKGINSFLFSPQFPFYV